jgi:hypothetical protein
MNHMIKFGFLLPFFFTASAWAAGGACPSGANYINPANPTGSLVSLASLGVTSCYYVAASGSDSNSGTSESSPWLHAPGMPAATGNAQAAWTATIQPGTGIILRGGDTWHEGNNGASPYTGGAWGWNSSPGPQGTQAHPIYVGVDLTWYSGNSWARPILTWDNPTTTSQTLSSCSYPSGNIIDFDGGAWFILDDFELTGVCTTSANWSPIYVSYGSMTGAMYIERNYLHGSSHVGFPNPNNCTLNSTCMSAFRGGTQSAYLSTGGDYLLFNVADFSDSDGVPMEGEFGGGYFVAYNYFNNISQLVTTTQHVWHDNTVVSFVDNGHANLLESDGDYAGSASAIATYNNVFSNVFTLNDGVYSNVCFWPYPPVGSTHYFFNNLTYNVGACELFNIGQNNANQGTMALFNDTFQNNNRTDGGGNSFSCSATGNSDPYTDANIQFISDNLSGSFYAANCSGKGTDVTSLLMTNPAATAAAYMSSQSYAYSPTSSSSPTVLKGTNEQSFCSALAAAAATDSSLSDAASACQSDTRYGVVYNSGNHTVSSPGRTSNTRPGSSAWDIGAYEYSTSLSPAPPTSNKAVVAPNN